MRISNSFSEGEIQVLEFIVQTLLRGGTPTMATRHKEFASLCRKVMAMKNKVIEKHEKERNAPNKDLPEETISADSEIPVDVAGEESEENLVQVVQ
jgi:hypothetical protein